MKEKILQLLADKKTGYLSGEEISRVLDVSRTAVWKHIKALQAEGYEIDAQPRAGYRLLNRPDILSAEEIKAGLRTKKWGTAVYAYQEIDSTNNMAKILAAEGAAEGTVVIAEKQNRGKGRLGRSWSSPTGGGLWFSVIFRPACKPVLAPQLIFIGAVAACKALRKTTGLPVQIKWPNDLLLEGKKICGILTELSAEIDMVNYVVMGIGINVNQMSDDFPEDLQGTATSLAIAAGHSFRRVELMQEIIFELESEYQLFQKAGFAQTLEKWRLYNCTLGQNVQVITGKDCFTGFALDIDNEGQLLVVDKEGKTTTVVVGDVSIRRKQ